MENKEVHTFPWGISPKVNVIARMEVELTYFKAAHWVPLSYCLVPHLSKKLSKLPLTSRLQSCILPIVKLATIGEGDPKAPFSIATTPRCREGRHSFPWMAPLYLIMYLIMLSVKQGGIKYHFFFSLWYDTTWDWTPVSRVIGEHYP